MDSIQDRHGNIQKYNIRTEFLRSLHSGLTVAYRADHVATFGGQQFTDILKHLLVVIGQQNTGSGQVSALLLVQHQPILKDLASRHKIDYPLLADPDSKVIRSFNVLNAEAKGMTAGMALPGFFFIDSNGVIREKYFTPKYTDRLTANNLIAKLFPELGEEVSQDVEAPHLQLTLAQSDRDVIPGGRVSLIADIELPPDVHVYSPGVQGYKPIQLTLQQPSGIEFQPVIYPQSKELYLEAIKEHVPVFAGKFRISQDLTVTPSKASDAIRAVFSKERTVSISGELKYQACDKTICYPPTSVPVKWELRIRPLDLKRSPESIQHK